MVSRVRRPGIPDPLYETIPDTMISVVCIVFAVTCISGLVKWVINSKQNHPRQMVG